MHGAYLAHIHTTVSGAHGAAGTGGSVIVAILGTIVAFVVPCAILLFGAIRPPRPGSRDDEDPDSGWGRGGGGGPPGPDGGPPHPETGPAWWPDFERQFAAYVERARYAERVVVTSHAGQP